MPTSRRALLLKSAASSSAGSPSLIQAFTTTSTPQLYAFNIQPDAALQSPVPFITQSTGGAMPNPSVSALYVATVAAHSAPSTSTRIPMRSPRYLQASLGINGQGSSQIRCLSSAPGHSSRRAPAERWLATASCAARPGGASAPVRTDLAAATVADGHGNNFFGSNTRSVGSCSIRILTAPPPKSGAAARYPHSVGPASTNYAFNQPAIATPAPASGSRTTQTLSGSFGGVVYPTSLEPGSAPLIQ